MSEYRPSDDEVRGMANSFDGVPNDVFDRWLAAHDERVRTEERERYRKNAEGTISIPRPHVPYGPSGVPEHVADADYLAEAARHIEGGYPVGGSNLTATVIRLLRDAAAAIRAVSAEQEDHHGSRN